MTSTEGGAPAPTPVPLQERLEQLTKLKEEARHAGSDAAIQRQHDRGKLTTERLDILLDDGSFVELDMLARHRAHGFGIEHTRPLTDGIVTGWAKIDGRKVFVWQWGSSPSGALRMGLFNPPPLAALAANCGPCPRSLAGPRGGWLVLDDGDPDLDKYTKDNPLRDRGDISPSFRSASWRVPDAPPRPLRRSARTICKWFGSTRIRSVISLPRRQTTLVIQP